MRVPDKGASTGVAVHRREFVAWWVLTAAVATNLVWAVVAAPYREFWTGVVGRSAFVNAHLVVSCLQPVLLAIASVALFLVYRKRLPKSLRLLAMAAVAFIAVVAAIGIATNFPILRSSLFGASFAPSPTIVFLGGLNLLLEMLRQGLVISLLVALAVHLFRTARCARWTVPVLFVLASALAIQLAIGLPQSQRSLVVAFGSPNWGTLPGWLEARYWFGFRGERTFQMVLEICQGALTLLLTITGGLLSRNHGQYGRGRCGRCGYELVGLPSALAACPECGGSIAPAKA